MSCFPSFRIGIPILNVKILVSHFYIALRDIMVLICIPVINNLQFEENENSINVNFFKQGCESILGLMYISVKV